MNERYLFFVAPVFALSSACSTSSGARPEQDASTSDGNDTSCAAGVLGDVTKPIDFQFRVLGVDGKDAPLADGNDVPLIFPPQGGRVIFIGVRATNLDGCGLQLTGALRDEHSNEIQVDARTVNLYPTGDGWGTSGDPTQSLSAARASYSNVPLCPNQWATTDLYDHEFQLEVTIEDREKRTLTQAIKVTPRCAEPENLAECLCICKVGYVLGQTCPTDAGTDR